MMIACPKYSAADPMFSAVHLRERVHEAWFDEERLQPGQDWEELAVYCASSGGESASLSPKGDHIVCRTWVGQIHLLTIVYTNLGRHEEAFPLIKETLLKRRETLGETTSTRLNP